MEETQYSEPSQVMGWPDAKDLDASDISQFSARDTVSSEKAGPSNEEAPIESRESFFKVIDPDHGHSEDDPESLVPLHVVRELETRMTKPTRMRCKGNGNKGSNKGE